jgi:hypothetical protein
MVPGGRIAGRAIRGNRRTVPFMDWDAWARQAEAAIDVAARGDWKGLFAPGASFTDPVNDTDDLRAVARQTRDLFPDWRQEITWIRGGDDWAAFEWIGRATYDGKVPIEMHGATIVEVDADGLVTRWQDYLDRKEPELQIKTWFKQ